MSHTEPDSGLTHVRRQPARGIYDRGSIYRVLDEALVAHVAFVERAQPFCIPMMQARVGDSVCVHGSTASRMMRVLGSGAPACLTVTMLDALVLARSAFEHSANYRSAVLLGSFKQIDETSERLAAFEAFTNKLVPGRWAEVRPPSPAELKASVILAMSISAASAKIRSGPPSDDGSPDAGLLTWAGVVPLRSHFDRPQPSPGLQPGIAIPESVMRLIGRTEAAG